MTTTQETELREALTSAFAEFTAAFSAFSDDEINRVPAPGKWTPAQVATHIILATDGVPDEKTEPSNRSVDAMLPAIRPWWEDLNQKFTSPEPLRPGNEPRAKQKILLELSRVRDKDVDILTQNDLSVLCMDSELPTIGFLTRFEWLWFIEMHLRRHTFQLENYQKLM